MTLPMRIAFLNTLYPPHGASGAETTLRFLAGALAARGHRCGIVTLTPEAAESRGEVDGIPVRYLPLANVYWPHGGERPRALRPAFQALDAFNPVMGRRLARVLGEEKPDVLHCHNLQGFSVSAWDAARRAGVPVVQTLHDYYLACPRSAMWRPGRGNCATQCAECRAFALPRRRLSAIPAAVTCVSRRVLERVTAVGTFPGLRSGAQPGRVIRGNNPPGLVPAPLPPPDGTLRLGFMGRLDPSKGLENLLDALAGLPRGAASLRVAGRGEPAYVEALRARGQPRDDVRFLGHVPPAALFAAIDLLVIPSVWEDPFPRVFHEALACGVPSLVSPLGGLPEAIAPGRDGFVAPGADAAALGRALGALARDGWDRAAVRDNCLAAAAAFEADRIVSQYEAVLAAAAAGRAPPDDAGEPWPGKRAARSHPQLETAHGP